MLLPTKKFSEWAARLRFPNLVLLTGAVFVADLLFPDALPLVDEVILGLVTLVLSRIRRPPTDSGPEINRDSSSAG